MVNYPAVLLLDVYSGEASPYGLGVGFRIVHCSTFHEIYTTGYYPVIN